MGFPAFILSLAAWTIEISHLKISYFIINPPQKCQDAKIIQYLSLSLLWPTLSFSAFTLLQTASKIGMSYLISSSFMITHFQKCPECQKWSISVIIAVLANFEPLSQQIDVPLGIPKGLSAFTLLQTAGKMGISYITFSYSIDIHFWKCQKYQKCSISVTIAVLANFEPLSQQKDVPLGLPMGFSAFTLLQTASKMGISYLTFFYFIIIHLQKCPKCQKCSISINCTIAVLANFEPLSQQIDVPLGLPMGFWAFTLS